MTFLNPAILWGLAAISIPIIIHIFNLKKTKKIEFSTLMFLKEIQQSKYKKIKLKQLLILLCRIAFIIFLVMMFAKPFDSGYLGSEGEKARSSVLIILDNSFSMQTRAATGNDFDNAKQKISEMLGVLDENDEIFFTTVSDINRLDRNIVFKDINHLKDSLQNIKTSDVSKNLNEVLFFAREILKSASHSYKEIYIFTDGQKSFVENQNIITNETKFDDQTKVNFVLVGSRPANNLSLDTINTVTRIFEKSKPVKVKATVNNHNGFNVSNKSVILNFGTVKDEKVIDVPANSSVDVEFAFNPAGHGFAGGNIELVQSEISDDEISSDNKQYFSFYVPQKISLLLVSNSAVDVDYIKLALVSSEELMKDSLGGKSKYFDITESTELSSHQLNNYDAVVIVNKPQFSGSDAATIKDYIENGGGVVIYPGASASLDNYNNVLMKETSLPNINSVFGNDNITYKFDKIDFEHPVFEGIFKQSSGDKKLNVESPTIKSGWNLGTGENSATLVTLNSEKNFMVEYTKGKGRLLMFGVSPDMGNSDYPAKNLFSPITVRSILYLSSINDIKPAVTGNDYFVDLTQFNNLPDSVLISPVIYPTAGSTIEINDKQALLNLNRYLNYTSLYYLNAAGSAVYEFSANFNKTESRPAKFDNKEIANYLKDRYTLQADVISPLETVSASVLELRTGREIWHYFLILALIFLAVEYFIAKTMTIKNKK